MTRGESPGVTERTLVLLVAAVQFVNILDFMMVMPMGPDFAKALHVPTSEIGLIGGSYTVAAAISGLISATFLDRFDRRPALGLAMIGLVLGTAAGGLAVDLHTLMAARVLAGIFGGPATSLSLSIVADAVPPERRGRAMGTVMTAFAVASVLGVPAGLELASRGGWRAPFFAVAGLGIVVALLAVFFIPPMRRHLDESRGPAPRMLDLVRAPVLWTSVATATIMAGNFILVPNISAYVQFNLGYPRERLGLLYLVGGAVNFVTLPFVGRLVDRFGSSRVTVFGTLAFVGVLYVGFVDYVASIPVLALFVSYMVTSTFRSVPWNTLSSKVPHPAERARFLSVQSVVQHLAAGGGAIASSTFLRELPGGKLEGIPRAAWISIGLAGVLPPVLFIVEKLLARDARLASTRQDSDAPASHVEILEV